MAARLDPVTRQIKLRRSRRLLVAFTIWAILLLAVIFYTALAG